MKRVTIVGAGPAGLACAFALERAGVSVQMIEAETCLGGRVQSHRSGDWLVEKGPAAILDNNPATREIVKYLDLSSEVLTSDAAVKRRYLVRSGRLVAIPSSPLGLLTTSLLSARGKARLFGDLLQARGVRPDESVASFFRRHLGNEATEQLVDPMQSGIFAGDIEQLSLLACFPQLATLEARHGSLLRGAIVDLGARRRPRLLSLRGGLHRIIVALAVALKGPLNFGQRLTTLPETEGPLVLAIPAQHAAPLVRGKDPRLADLLQATRMVPIATVCLGYARSQVAHPLDGFGFLVPHTEPMPQGRILGTIFMSSLFPEGGYAPPGHVSLRVLLGGAHDLQVEQLDDRTLVDRASGALRHLLHVTGEPVFVDVARWSHGIDQYAVGHLERLAEIEARGKRLGLSFIGSSYRGHGLNDALAQGWALGHLLAERA